MFGQPPLLLENIQTPMLFKSEEEQLVGHDLIKALNELKLSSIPPLSPLVVMNHH
jgi:hypothetical protein